jgi:hypothetical protein
MTVRKYTSRSQQTTLSSAVTSGATVIPVTNASTLFAGTTLSAGQTFTIVIDPDTALEEICDVTAASSNNLTVTRAVDMSGASAQDHSSGAVVRHMIIGRDLREANLHIEASAAYNDGTGTHSMHGLGTGDGSVVGTDATQTLSNKTLASPIITGTPGIDTSIIFEGTTADAYETTLTVVDPTADRTITLPNATGTVVLKDTTDILTNKTLTSPTISGSPVITGLSSAGMSASSAAPKDYVDSILGSATAASTSAASAATSASSAATSASSAATSASLAATSASSALTSQTAATTSAASAATSATAAATSATSAAASATAAATSASSAAAATSAVATSAASALASQTAAATSATSAAASATAAATSASSAATSATSAATSASSSLATYNTYKTYYLGSFASAPTLDNQGNALITGATYWNSVAGVMYAWSGSAWSAISTANGAVTTGTLAQFAATTSAQLAGVISDETGTGALVFANSPTLVTPTLGTPASATLTNATGLPVSGITASTTTALGVGSIELGHATDTTISRASAGVVNIEGVPIVTTTASQTLTNKTLTSPILTTPSISNIDAKGDILVGTANDTLGVLTAGNNGETLVADSSTSTGLRYQSGYNGNAIINGGMDIWQRGTSFASQGSLGSAAYTADRWHFFRSAGASNATLSRQTSGLTGIQYCARLQRNSGTTGTESITLRYTAESADSYRFAGQTVTISYYARAGANYSSASNALNVTLASGTGTDQPVYSFTSYTSVTSQSIALTTSWQRFTATGTVASNVTEIGIEAFYTPVGTAGANDYFEITGVQVEIGSVATAFKRSASGGGTIQGELDACRYYYRRITADATALYQNMVNVGYASTTTDIAFPILFDTPMRTTPSSVEYANLRTSDGLNAPAVNSLTIVSLLSNKNNILIIIGTTGAVQFRPYALQANNSATAYLGWSAEL